MQKWVYFTACTLLMTAALQGKPSGHQVKHGRVSVSQHSKGIQIHQESKHAVIHWENFSIAEGELAEFFLNQEGATLNRVTGNQLSSLMGTLRSNGKLYLINPHGILIGPKGCIDTKGCLLSTLDLSDFDFLNDKEMWFKGNSEKGIVNLGTIRASQGDLFLLARVVDNQGQIEAPQGVVGFGIGTEVLVVPAGQERLQIKVPVPTGLATNTSVIEAAFIEVQGAAENPYGLAVKQTGTMRAQGVEKHNGKVLLTAKNGTVDVSGSIYSTGDMTVYGENLASLTGELLSEGGTIELSGNEVEWKGRVDAQGGSFTLDPYNVWMGVNPALRPALWSYVDVNPGAPLLLTLGMGTDVTITTASSAGYDEVGSSALQGDITINDPISWIGDGSLDLIADRDIALNQAIFNAGNGQVTLSAGRNLTLDPDHGSIGTQTGNIIVLVDNTLTAVHNGSGPLFSASDADVILNSTNGDITVVGSIVSNNLTIEASPTGSLWIGNDATGVLSTGASTLFQGPSLGYELCLNAGNVTIRAGAATGENVRADKETTCIEALFGDLIVQGGASNNSSVDLRSSTGNSLHTYAAAGNLQFLGGQRDNSPVLIGNYGLGGLGSLLLSSGSDCILTSGGNLSQVDIRSSGGAGDALKVGTGGVGNLVVTALEASVILSMNQGNSAPATYSILGNLNVTGGIAPNASAQLFYAGGGLNVGDITTPGNVSLMGGSASNAGASLSMSAEVGDFHTIFGDVYVIGGSGENAVAFLEIPTLGNAINVAGDVDVIGGIGNFAEGVMDIGTSILTVNGSLSVAGQNGAGSFLMNSTATQIATLLVEENLSVFGGNSTSAGSVGEAAISCTGSFYAEVAGDLTVTGGIGTGASGQIASLFFPPFTGTAEQTVYVRGNVNLVAGSGDEATATIDFFSFGFPGEQYVEVGQNLIVSGGSGQQAIAGIRNSGIYDPNGLIFGAPIDVIAPLLNIQVLGNIVATNGSGNGALGVIGTTTGLNPPVPGVQIVSGSLSAAAGGDVQVSTSLDKSFPFGNANLNNQISIVANQRFTPGQLWPGNSILGVSGPSLYPSGEGAFIAGAPLSLATYNGSIQVFTAAQTTTGTPSHFAHIPLTTHAGNVALIGFDTISIDYPLITVGSTTLFPWTVRQVQIQSLSGLTVNQPITLTGANFGIRLFANNGNLELNSDVAASPSSGLVELSAFLGSIEQTSTNVSGYSVKTITNTGLEFNVSATELESVNLASGDLNVVNTLAGSHAIYSKIDLYNGAGGTFNGQNITFTQLGGTSARIVGATANGDIQLGVLAGVGDLLIQSIIRPGQHVLGVANGNLEISSVGQIHGVDEVTLICDQAYPHYSGPGWFRNHNGVNGVTTDNPAQNIAIYTSSGPQGSTIQAPNHVILGNLGTVAIWDDPNLDGKYATTYSDGGVVHGPGFGTDYTAGNGVFGSPVIWYKFPLEAAIPPVPPIPPHVIPNLTRAIFAMQGLTLQPWGFPFADWIRFSLWDQHLPFYHYGLMVPFNTHIPHPLDPYEYALDI